MPRFSSSLALCASALLLLAAGCSNEQGVEILVPAEFERDILTSERAALAAQSDLELGLLRGLVAGNLEHAATSLTSDFRATFPAVGEGTSVPDGAYRIALLNPSEETLDGAQWLQRLAAYTAHWKSIERQSFEPDRLLLSTDGRRATGRAELYLAGELQGGGRADLRATCSFELILDGTWRLRRSALLAGTRIESSAAPFYEVSAQTGFRYSLAQENDELLQSFIDEHQTLALGGLTALDWNRDGFQDLLATRKGQMSVLFLNDGRGGFTRAALPIKSPLESPAMALYVDLDGDGREEIVGSAVIEYAGEQAFLGLWTRDSNGAWELRPRALSIKIPRGRRRQSIQTIVPFDMEGDGDLDLFIGVYGDALSRGPHYNTVEAHDAAPNHLLVNQGELGFVEETEARGLSGTQYTYVALAFDLDGDGDTDLWEGNDFGPNHYWRNDGSGHFTAAQGTGLDGVGAYTMGVTLADWDNSGHFGLYISNMSAEAGGRVCQLPTDISAGMRKRLETIAGGNMLHVKPDGAEPWTEVAGALHCAEAEWAWGCIFADLDGDADKDLVVTNGFASHHRPDLPDWDSWYWNQVASDAGSLERAELSINANAGEPFEGSFAGYQRDRCYHNPDGQGGRFFDVAWHKGLDGTHDGRAIIALDVDGDGDLDLALWTLQGLRLYMNPSAGTSFTRLRLTARDSEAQALGAIVSVTAGGITQRGHVRLVEGFQSQVPRILHFGLANARRIAELRVDWPSGRVQTWKDLTKDCLLDLTESVEETRCTPVPRWPETSRPRAAVAPSARLVWRASHKAAMSTTTAQEGPLLVRFSEGGAQGSAGLETLHADHPALRILLLRASEVTAGADSGLRGLVIDTAQTTQLAQCFGAEAPTLPATFAFDARGRLARAWLHVVEVDELSAFLSTLDAEPAFPDLLVQAGRRELGQNRPRQAAPYFERALIANPSSAEACEGLGRTAVALGRVPEAEDWYVRSIAADPDYALGHYNLGITRLHLGKPARAIAPLQKALAIDGERAPMLLSLGEAAALADQLALAREAFERATRAAPDSVEAFTLLGKLLGGIGALEEARIALTRAIAIDADAADARRALRQVERLLAEGR